MSTFAYTAIGRDGKRTNGTLTADNRAAAISQVSRLGLHPVKVDESRNGKSVPAAVAPKPLPKAPARPAPEAAPRGGGLRGFLGGGAATPAKPGPTGAAPVPVLPL